MDYHPPIMNTLWGHGGQNNTIISLESIPLYLDYYVSRPQNMILVPPYPPSKIHPGFLPYSAIFPNPLSLPLLLPLCPFFFSRPSTSSSAGGHPSSVCWESAFRRTSGQCPAPGTMYSVPTYDSSPPGLCGWYYLVRVWVEGRRRQHPPRLS